MGETEIEKLEAILGYNNSPRSRLLQKQNLSENQKAKLFRIFQRTHDGIPLLKQKHLFYCGVIAGILLNELEWGLKQAKQNVNVTLGRHPLRLRGPAFIEPFKFSVGLACNVEPEKFNFMNLQRFIYIVDGFIEESRSEAFNNGFITGLFTKMPRDTSKEIPDEQVSN